MAKSCEECGKPSTWVNPLADGRLCNECWGKEQLVIKQEAESLKASEVASLKATREAAAAIILTTETAHNLPVVERLDIVTAEVVIGMHLFKDIAGVFRDVFGGRSKAMQDGLREARKAALLELRLEAHALGADAVVGVDLDYSEISGGGKSMLFLVASGTAVRLDNPPKH